MKAVSHKGKIIMAYPLEEISPEATDAEKMKAVQDTIQQLVAEGLSPEEAQSQAQKMLASIMQMPSFPTSGTMRMGESMKPPANIMRERGSSTPKSIGYFRNELDDQGFPGFVHGFNFDGNVSNK